MFILINSTCFGHYYAHHQENRLGKQLHVVNAWLCCVGSSRAELGHEQSALYESRIPTTACGVRLVVLAAVVQIWDTSCVHCLKDGV